MSDAINREGMLAYISKVRDSNMGRSAAIDFIYKYAENAPTVVGYLTAADVIERIERK